VPNIQVYPTAAIVYIDRVETIVQAFTPLAFKLVSSSITGSAMDSPRLIVARYLKANHFNEVSLPPIERTIIQNADENCMQSYEAFIQEAKLPKDAGTTSKDDLTLETLLEEKRVFDVSVRFEKLGVDDGEGKWKSPGKEELSFWQVMLEADTKCSTICCKGSRRIAHGIEHSQCEGRSCGRWRGVRWNHVVS
jgi:hypothetical protein